MKTIILITIASLLLSFYSCGGPSENLKEELATDLKTLAEDLATEESNVNSTLLLDKWWIADEEHGGSDQFFNTDGTYDTDFGTLGTWEWTVEGKTIKVVDNGKEAILEIIELTESKLKFKYNDFTYTYYPKQK